jgi:hypothetical protein
MVCALGVQLGEAHNGILKVCNTEKRMRETIGLLDDFMARGTLLKREALVLRGRLRFVTPLFSETWKDRSSGHHQTCTCVPLQRCTGIIHFGVNEAAEMQGRRWEAPSFDL